MQNFDNYPLQKKRQRKFAPFNSDPKFLQSQYKTCIENKAVFMLIYNQIRKKNLKNDIQCHL